MGTQPIKKQINNEETLPDIPPEAGYVLDLEPMEPFPSPTPYNNLLFHGKDDRPASIIAEERIDKEAEEAEEAVAGLEQIVGSPKCDGRLNLSDDEHLDPGEALMAEPDKVASRSKNGSRSRSRSRSRRSRSRSRSRRSSRSLRNQSRTRNDQNNNERTPRLNTSFGDFILELFS